VVVDVTPLLYRREEDALAASTPIHSLQRHTQVFTPGRYIFKVKNSFAHNFNLTSAMAVFVIRELLKYDVLMQDLKFSQ
jgi:hypothetical protein